MVKRRNLIAGAVAGGVGAVLLSNSSAFADSTALASPAVVAAIADSTVEPGHGAGLYDVDPDQGSVSQAPNSSATGDVAAMPEDWSF